MFYEVHPLCFVIVLHRAVCLRFSFQVWFSEWGHIPRAVVTTTAAPLLLRLSPAATSTICLAPTPPSGRAYSTARKRRSVGCNARGAKEAESWCKNGNPSIIRGSSEIFFCSEPFAPPLAVLHHWHSRCFYAPPPTPSIVVVLSRSCCSTSSSVRSSSRKSNTNSRYCVARARPRRCPIVALTRASSHHALRVVCTDHVAWSESSMMTLIQKTRLCTLY